MNMDEKEFFERAAKRHREALESREVSVSTETMLLLDEVVERLKRAQCSKSRIEEISLKFKSAVNFKGDKGAWKDENDNIHINGIRFMSGAHFSIAKDGSIKMIAMS